VSVKDAPIVPISTAEAGTAIIYIMIFDWVVATKAICVKFHIIKIATFLTRFELFLSLV